MADFRDSGEDDALPGVEPAAKQQQADKDGSTADNASSAKQSGEGGDGVPPAQGPPGQKGQPPRPGVDPALARQVNQVMASELGIPTLLNRLKQSVASATEYALFLKKRSVLEDDHAQGLKKLCRLTQESSRRPEHRQGSFAQSYDEMIFIHERMAENGSQFAASLHQMHEDLLELAANAERGRKSWKTNGMAAEQKVADLEQSMRKSKAKYDSLAEEYDRARTGEARPGGGKVLGAFKAHKSAAQQEEDLLRKVQAADQTYQGHVNSLQAEKSHLISSARPEAVKALQELIAETDSGVTLQMQKFAAFNEKLLLGNGLIVSPFKSPGGDNMSQPRSLRQAVAAIDNVRDLNEFVAVQHTKVQPNYEVKYERNPLLKPTTSTIIPPTPQSLNMPQAVGQAAGQQGTSFSQQTSPVGQRGSTGNLGPPGGPQGSLNQGMPPPGGPQDQQPRQFQQPHTRSFSQGNTLNQQSAPQQPFASRNSVQPAPRYGNGSTVISQGPPQLGALPFQGSQPPAQQSSPQQSGSPFQPPQDRRGSAGGFRNASSVYGAPGQSPPPQNVAAPSKPVYGVSLNRLYERDGLAVPMVVYQCIQAVDLFGLGLEGIYRQSGSLNHINKLKGMFDAESQNPALDFRNPENFYHDVNSVTGLLKQFLRDLPDPLLTNEHHDALIIAASKPYCPSAQRPGLLLMPPASTEKGDDIVRRDSLHAIINALPDPNYATLRALTLHLYRVMDNSHINRMNSHNLAVIFGPTLMGSDPSTAIADAGWQIKVIDTILQNTYKIFDDD
ncbi:RHO GTPase-activating protein RGD1 [Tolypocladium ophioglossoides CBS 100239]|uniref:RHO GTPase-activating protein RGD1 n=1 Tax=Tolypocladium ophioglossoides (strain CBS 100239) TaxID=1163406 RepID=A0A0L0N1S8_TOLOC|nr:RHO GTPase-activating protein RGD1 [Tolypocladium ophioglossoides CBS 100239]